MLADQLQAHLQQQQEEARALHHSLEEQQGVVSRLQIQLEQSRSEAAALQSQLALSHDKEEEAHQRAQLQEVLGEQLLSQLQEATQQRDEYERIAHELKSALADSQVHAWQSHQGFWLHQSTVTNPNSTQQLQAHSHAVRLYHACSLCTVKAA